MPEGPEIRRAADRLFEAVGNQPLEQVWFYPPALKGKAKGLLGRRIIAIDTHGKAMLTRFDNGTTLYTHNQLYGVWMIAKSGERPETTRSLRVALETETAAILLYSASDIALWKNEDLATHPFLSKLGPDVLDKQLTAAAVAKRLQEPRFARMSLAALLLDQSFLAGMGNYLRSEVLFEAGIAPTRDAAGLNPDERKLLAKALLDVPRRSYRSRGIRKAGGMRAEYITDTAEGFAFKVFDLAGEPCPDCGTTIRRRELAGRRLYDCPHCQR
ncbi:DNA-(apurinic or apyrimidinic site) lyase /endonuclease VIII [Pseudoxanthomonas sp. GM95]|uniref:endonuclease VIII n=1 Tax=Pseudoxanthomonas sp. GM95 TaxID=1881043 RepID=UPI0008C6907E|nr:endonuclease VIII [Pseudoxanthomonas sp. GM95]SEL03422.1 DNA-(apurinic or apyrimidinic site) lyase /endonuclease VIII [Pseudoxanthomonas sp. GM95]